MVRPVLLALSMLVACGSTGVCAGCGGAVDADDAPPMLPDDFAMTAVLETPMCGGDQGDETTIEIRDAHGMPSQEPFYSAGQCAVAIDDGDSWAIECLNPGFGRMIVDVNHGLDGGTIRGGRPEAGACLETYTITTFVAL